MGLFKSILKSKAVEDGIEKVIQYGKKTLTVMKPEVSEWAVLNGGTTVPKSMIEYYEKGGMKPISTFAKSVKEVLIKNGNQTEKLIISQNQPLTGVRFPDARGKRVVLQIYKGNEVSRVSELSADGYGRSFRTQIFN